MIWRLWPWHIPLADAARLVAARYRARKHQPIPEPADQSHFVHSLLGTSNIKVRSTVNGGAVVLVAKQPYRLWTRDGGVTLIRQEGDQYQRFTDPRINRLWLWWHVLEFDAGLHMVRGLQGRWVLEGDPEPGWGNVVARWAFGLFGRLLADRRALRGGYDLKVDWHKIHHPNFWETEGWKYGDPKNLLFGPDAPFAPRESFNIVDHKIDVPPGLSYEWKAQDRLQSVSKQWKRVPASRHPDLPREGKYVAYRGLLLMQRPKQQTKVARDQDIEDALNRVRGVRRVNKVKE